MNFRKTKILVTLGPATASPAMMEKLIQTGANAFRLNFSHGTEAEHLKQIQAIRKLSKKLNIPIPVVADLPGPKLRTGLNQGGIPFHLDVGAKTVLTTREVLGTPAQIPVMYQKLPTLVGKGDRILLSDGMLELKVLTVRGTEIQCKVTAGGELGEHKGINLPGLHLKIPSITEKDRGMIKNLARLNVDYIALSFVQRAQDIVNAKKMLLKHGKKIPIIAKIEKPEAVDHIDSILEASDGIMIARGDLGVELPAAEVPVIQKEIIHLSALKYVPVITATQMLDSMVHSPRPTRAESTDVANAIWDGTDIVMLSNETAAGAYPIEAVQTMANIIDQAEGHPDFQWSPPIYSDRNTDVNSILTAANSVADPRIHKAIVTYTKTGSTAVALSKLRPRIPIFALTPEKSTYQRLGLIWGVKPFLSLVGNNPSEMIKNGDSVLIKHAGLKKKDKVILVAGTQLTSGATNLLKVHQIGGSFAR